MTTPNSIRGETSTKIGDETFLLRPSFEALTRIESALAMNFDEIILHLHGQRRGIGMVVRILYECAAEGAEHGSAAIDYAEFGALVLADGIDVHSEKAASMLAAAFKPPSGGVKKKPKAKTKNG